MTIRLKVEFVSAEGAEMPVLEDGLTGNDDDAILAAEHAIAKVLGTTDVELEIGTALDAIARGGRARREALR